jgi:hypothetical protein
MKTLTRHDTRQLREFGIGLGLILLAIFWGLLPWLGDRPRPMWPVAASGILALAALAWPPAILPVYRLMLPVARVVGFVNTWLLLGAVFFGILLPVGLALRGLGRLQYRTGFRSDLVSYRVEVPREHATRLEEPF